MPLLIIVALLIIGGAYVVYENISIEPLSIVKTKVQQSNEIQPVNTQTPKINTQKDSINIIKATTNTVAQSLPPLNFNKPLTTSEDNQAFLDDLNKRPAMELISAWKQQITKTNYAQLDFLEIALSMKIKANPDSTEAKAIYSFANDFLKNGTPNDSGTRIRLVKWLGQGGGVPVVGILLNLFDQTSDKELQREILSQLINISSISYGSNAEAISRIFETRWHDAVIPKDMSSGSVLFTFGPAIAKLGTSGGVKVLLDDVLRGGQTRSYFKSNADLKSQIALMALDQVRSDSSIALLAQGMKGSSDDMRLFASGETLTNISSPASTKVLVDWAVQADDTDAILVENWLSRLRDTDSRKVVRYLFIDPVTFHSDQVKQAVARAIKSY